MRSDGKGTGSCGGCGGSVGGVVDFGVVVTEWRVRGQGRRGVEGRVRVICDHEGDGDR